MKLLKFFYVLLYTFAIGLLVHIGLYDFAVALFVYYLYMLLEDLKDRY